MSEKPIDQLKDDLRHHIKQASPGCFDCPSVVAACTAQLAALEKLESDNAKLRNALDWISEATVPPTLNLEDLFERIQSRAAQVLAETGGGK